MNLKKIKTIPNKQVKLAPVGRWDAQTARAPYLSRYVQNGDPIE